MVTGICFAAKPQKKTETVTFSVSIHCQNCANKITENVSFEKGVKDLTTDLKSKTISITYDPAKTDTLKLANSIRKLGYKVERK